MKLDKAIEFFENEVRFYERAPAGNIAQMTSDWLRMLDAFRTALAALKERKAAIDGCDFGEFHKIPPQTNADRIRAMTDEELTEMLFQLGYSGEGPWSYAFDRKFCDSCPAPEYTLENGRKMNLHECDFSDGECPHGSNLIWWLQQPVEEVQG